MADESLDEFAAYMAGLERHVLGTALLHPPSAALLASCLSPADFWSMRYAVVFDAMQALYRNGRPIDVVTVATDLDDRGLLRAVGGAQMLHDMISGAPTPADYVDFPRVVGTMGRYGAWQWS